MNVERSRLLTCCSWSDHRERLASGRAKPDREAEEGIPKDGKMKLRETVRLEPQDTAGETCLGHAGSTVYVLRATEGGPVLFVGEREEIEVEPLSGGVASWDGTE